MAKLTCLIHKGAKPGMVLKFANGDTKLVTKSGTQINVVRGPDGQLSKAAKPLSKKARRKLRLLLKTD